MRRCVAFNVNFFFLTEHSYATRAYSYAIRISLVSFRMSLLCHSYVTRVLFYVTPMYSYVTRMSLVCTALVCHLYVFLPWTVNCNQSHHSSFGLFQPIPAQFQICASVISRYFRNLRFFALVYIYLLKFFELPWYRSVCR